MSSSTDPNLDSRETLILYATETGNAQEAADRVARECRRIHIRSRVLSMDAYSPADLISESLVIFIVSTTGSGVEPRSMTLLWNMLLRSDLPADLFEDLQFTVFGLGDTSYEKFCWPAKRLARRLETLGATRFCDSAEGDEQHLLGIDGALQPWIDTLIKALLQLLPLPAGLEMISTDEVPPARVTLIDHLSKEVVRKDPLADDEDYHLATVTCNSRQTANDWYQDVRHLEFSFQDDIEYSPGDIAVIHPLTDPDAVDTFLTEMGWGNFGDEVFEIQHTHLDQSLPDHLPRYSCLREIFTRYLDFNAVPRRTFFRYLRYFTTDELEGERLDEFLSPSTSDELYEYCFRVRRTIREVLSEFRHVRIPKEYIFDIFPTLRPRLFSIASSVKKYPREIHLCVAIVKYRTKLKIPRRGVCSMYLSGLQPGDRLQIGIQKGFIKLPPDNKIPIICVGPGTGVAPMRSIIQERIHNGSSANTLYFGCRSGDKDQHYKSEWQAYVANSVLTYRVACSRDGPESVKRTYVQDLMSQDGKRLWDLLQEHGAYVFISGSSNKMPAGVKDALKSAVQVYGAQTASGAAEYIQNLERTGRLIEECWS